MTIEVQQKIETFFKGFVEKQFKKGHVIIDAGDEPQGVYFIELGEVRQYAIANNGDEIVVNVFKSPAFFPMSWALNKTPNEYFYEAASDTKLHIAPPAETTQFIQDNPDVLLDLLTRVYRGTDALLRRMTHLMKGTARSRTILEIIIAGQRFGKKLGNEYVIEIPEVEIAARAGLSRETVSRELHKLHKRGLLNISRRNIIINDMDKLERELGDGL